MNQKHYLWRVSVCIVIAALLLTACGGGETTTPVVESSATTTESTEETTAATVALAEPTATPEPRDRIPEILVVHPDAFDFEITEATNTYVYVVPIMVADTTAYLETELKARGWKELGKPTVMGHLATLIMQREGYRLTVSMQDNERSMTTRVQMLLMEQ